MQYSLIMNNEVIERIWNDNIGWIRSYTKKSQWRTLPELDNSDLEQEIYMKLIKLLDSDPSIADDADKAQAKLSACAWRLMIDITRHKKYKETNASHLNASVTLDV